MRTTPEELEASSRYVLLEKVDHDNLVPAVQAFMKPSSLIKIAYLMANIVVLGALGAIWVATGTPIFPGINHLCMGMAVGYVVLLPIHEHVHALAYRWLGATSTMVVYRWRTLTAYCVADRFVVTGREFLGVCLAPFLLLNTMLLIAIVAVGGFPIWLWGMLLLHVGACSGDFAFANLAWRCRRDGLRTYDDVSRKTSSFYTTRSETPDGSQSSVSVSGSSAAAASSS